MVAELDRAAPSNPVVLHHRTGHVAILNTAARTVLGAGDADDVLVDAHALLSRVPHQSPELLRTAVAAFGQSLARHGITALTDATHTNGAAEIRLLGSYVEDGLLPVDLTVMVGWDRLAEVDLEEPRSVRVGPAKIMPIDGDRTLQVAVSEARQRGFTVAIHVDDVDILEDALNALQLAPPSAEQVDRIEHCSLALDEQVSRIGRMQIEVVTQPTFLESRWRKYRSELSEAEYAWLWRLRSLRDAGVPIRFSSDSPVGQVRPLQWVRSAVVRDLNPNEEITLTDALRACTVGPLKKGSRTPVAILDGHPLGEATSVQTVFLQRRASPLLR
jgi:predicted amidohydrolase YtcJ